MTAAVMPAMMAEAEEWLAKRALDPDLWLYREQTVALLKRYFRLSVEVGRLPSLLGREFFRSRVSSRQVTTFEDTVIFVHDVERALEKLDEFEKKLIAVVVLQDHAYTEVAHRLKCERRTVGRQVREALDHLSEILLTGGLLKRLPDCGVSSLRSGTAEAAVAPCIEREKSCQEGKVDEFLVSDSEQSK